MSDSWKPFGAYVTSMDVSPATPATAQPGIQGWEVVAALLKEILRIEYEQLQLLREMVQAQREARQRQAMELLQWQKEHPEVVRKCREALSALVRVHSGFLQDLAEHVVENEEMLLESDFSLSDFVDRYGPRLHHLSAALSVLKQVATPIPEPPQEEEQ